MDRLPFTYKEFLSKQTITLEEICRGLVKTNRDRINIKKEERAVQNLHRIVQAVLSLSQTKGFSAMSLRDLSQETDLSMGALYNYFNSKEELFQMIYTQGRTSVFDTLEANAVASDPELRLQQSICAHLYLSEALPRVFSFFFMEARNLPAQLQKNIISLEQLTEGFFEEILQEGKKKNQFALEDTQLTASAIKALLQDWYLKRYKFSTRRLNVEKYASFVIDFVGANLK